MPAVPVNIETTAKLFWEEFGEPVKYPRDIQQAISLTKNVFIVSIPRLSIDLIQQWLYKRGFQFSLPIFNHPLHGFLLINQGAGFIFLNSTDDEKERRYTLAHEIGHYILDYEHPRQMAIKQFGSSILEVLDGLRLPTIEERLKGLIANHDLASFSHILDEEALPGFGRLHIWDVENRADQLAFELLAPVKHIRGQLRQLNIPIQYAEYKAAMTGMFYDYYGIPSAIAESYASHLAKVFTGGSTLAEQWGFR